MFSFEVLPGRQEQSRIRKCFFICIRQEVGDVNWEIKKKWKKKEINNMQRGTDVTNLSDKDTVVGEKKGGDSGEKKP